MPSETSEVERYSYDELKKAQAYCAENAVLAALRACGQTSDAQKEVFRAHVNDLCASVFAGALRQYNPTTKGMPCNIRSLSVVTTHGVMILYAMTNNSYLCVEVVEPVDHSMVARVAELEKQLKEKEATVNALRASVPQRAAQITQQKIEVERKRTAQVLGEYVNTTREWDRLDLYQSISHSMESVEVSDEGEQLKHVEAKFERIKETFNKVRRWSSDA